MSRIARPSIADPLIADSLIADSLIADSLIAALFWLKFAFGLVLVNK